MFGAPGKRERALLVGFVILIVSAIAVVATVVTSDRAQQESLWGQEEPPAIEHTLAPPLDTSGPPRANPIPRQHQRIPQQHRRGVVETIAGRAPVGQGSDCDVYITPAEPQNGINCRVRVTCAGRILYGHDEDQRRYGYTQCIPSESGNGQGVELEAYDREAKSQDGDARMELRSAADTLIVSDEDQGGSWSITVRLARNAN